MHQIYRLAAMWYRSLLGILVVVLLAGSVAACAETSGGASDEMAEPAMEDMAESEEDDDHSDDGGHDENYTFGSPGEAAKSSRVIEIITLDTMEFDPKTIEVETGETVTLHVVNEGTLTHDFTLGDLALQEEHEAEMAEMGGAMMADEPNAFSIEPGQSKDLVWTFSEPGEVIYACHTPGHYPAGMLGTITVK